MWDNPRPILDVVVMSDRSTKADQRFLDAYVDSGALGQQDNFHFSEVFVLTLMLGGPNFRQDDKVFLAFETKSPRAHLGEEGRVKFGKYGVGDSLDPFPEITIESIVPEESEVTFRMPKLGMKVPRKRQEKCRAQGL